MPALAERIGSYDPSAAQVSGADKANTLASVKAFAETAGILDAGTYPATIGVCPGVLMPWLQKAMTAREAAVAYNAENKVMLE